MAKAALRWRRAAAERSPRWACAGCSGWRTWAAQLPLYYSRGSHRRVSTEATARCSCCCCCCWGTHRARGGRRRVPVCSHPLPPAPATPTRRRRACESGVVKRLLVKRTKMNNQTLLKDFGDLKKRKIYVLKSRLVPCCFLRPVRIRRPCIHAPW
jgi:hypothetical protein